MAAEAIAPLADDDGFPFLDLPIEIRALIYENVLASMPTSYAYTPTVKAPSGRPPNVIRHTTNRRHGLLFVSRQISREYARAFYERSSFFFFVDQRNFMLNPPWPISHTVLPNLRQCKLYIEYSNCAKASRTGDFSRGALVKKMVSLCAEMTAAQSVRVVWADVCPGTIWMGGLTDPRATKEAWEVFAEPCLERLKKMRRMKTIWLQVDSREERIKRVDGAWVDDPIVLPNSDVQVVPKRR